jgi:predicted aldo/keto reductase-like oxidoreductase
MAGSKLISTKIPKQALGKTGIKSTILGFGGIPIQQVSINEAVAVVQRAVDLGINYFDTARAYSDSETKIGIALEKVRSRCIIATKSTAKTKSEMEQTIATSLKELRTDYIDIYQCHNIQNREMLRQVLAPDGAVAALKDAKKKGIIGHIGITSHSVPLLIEAIETTDVFETILVPYNYVETDIVDKLLPLAQKKRIGMIAMKPFGGGAFIDNPRMALKFVLEQPVSIALVGMQTVTEVEVNVRLSKQLGKLTPQEKKIIAQIELALGKNFCRRCGYCQPCSAGIEISYILNAKLIYKRYGWQNYISSKDKPKLDKVKDCIQCRKCETRCPYQLPIPDLLPGRVQDLEQIYEQSIKKENRITKP